MKAGTNEHRRLLVIVSGDYGELGAALYFLGGLRLSVPPLLLLPPQLMHALQSSHDLTVEGHRQASDIQRAVRHFRPDTVLLASGYLLTLGGGLSLLDLSMLLRQLRRLGVSVLTTDPFLGVRLNPLRLAWSNLRQPNQRDALLGALVLWPITGLLRRAWHVYPAPIARLPALAADPRCRGYLGGNTLAPTAPDRTPATAPAHWLFVISALEFRMLNRERQGGFIDQLIARLRDCNRAGRAAWLVGPGPLVRDLLQRLPDGPWLHAHGDLPYADYMHCLMAAEYAFFWNMMSFSSIHRVLADLPVFYFDEGHLARIHPAFWQAGIRLFYDGWHPPRLAVDQPLNPAALQASAEMVLPMMLRLSAGMRDVPLSADLLTTLPGAH